MCDFITTSFEQLQEFPVGWPESQLVHLFGVMSIDIGFDGIDYGPTRLRERMSEALARRTAEMVANDTPSWCLWQTRRPTSAIIHKRFE